MRQRYVARYIILPNTTEGRWFSVTAYNPIQALDFTHGHLQRTLKLAPAAYQITRLAIRHLKSPMLNPEYANEADYVESEFDLPDTPNPNISEQLAAKNREKALPAEASEAMPFFDEVTNDKTGVKPPEEIE